MSSLFKRISRKKPKRTLFNLSHETKLSADFGKIYPILNTPIVPGDTFKVNSSVFCRLSPMIAPIMHQCNIFVYYFFVPYRLLWNNWETFITGGEDGMQSENVVFPRINIDYRLDIDKNYIPGKFGNGTLSDYLGLPDVSREPLAGVPDTKRFGVSALPFRAYSLIYNEYFRDQNLMDPVPLSLEDGVDNETNVDLLNKCYEHDYFTSALPWTQRGGDVHVPISGEMDLIPGADLEVSQNYQTIAERGVYPPRPGQGISPGNLRVSDGRTIVDEGNQPVLLDNKPFIDMDKLASRLKGNVDSITPATINDLRRATKLQEWLELSARVGSRYVEQLMARFGVAPKDARLQRPEFLGSSKVPIQIQAIDQTSATPDIEGDTNETPLGTLAGQGIALSSKPGFRNSFNEYGLVMGLLSIVPRTSYFQGLERQWTKFDKFDYYFPEFAHLGEQEIKNSEVYAKSSNPDGTFGYTPRYAEYKNILSSVHGDFRNNLDFWHLSRKFDAEPALTSDFVECNQERDHLNRIFSVENSPDSKYQHFWLQVFHDIKAVRPMPFFGTPKF